MPEHLYYIRKDATELGPLTLSQLRSMWNRGEVTIKTPYRLEGWNGWKNLDVMQAILEGAEPPPISTTISTPPPAVAPVPKKKAEFQKGCGCAGLIGIVFLIIIVSSPKDNGGLAHGTKDNEQSAMSVEEAERLRKLYPPVGDKDEVKTVDQGSTSSAQPKESHKLEATGHENPSLKASPAAVSNVPVITWKEIDSFYFKGKNTDLQKAEKWKQYEGRNVLWSGTVASISEGFFGGLSMQVKMNSDTLVSDVFISLDEGQQTKAVNYTEGSRITFRGTLSDWGNFLGIKIENGVIVENLGQAK